MHIIYDRKIKIKLLAHRSAVQVIVFGKRLWSGKDDGVF